MCHNVPISQTSNFDLNNSIPSEEKVSLESKE